MNHECFFPMKKFESVIKKLINFKGNNYILLTVHILINRNESHETELRTYTQNKKYSILYSRAEYQWSCSVVFQYEVESYIEFLALQVGYGHAEDRISGSKGSFSQFKLYTTLHQFFPKISMLHLTKNGFSRAVWLTPILQLWIIRRLTAYTRSFIFMMLVWNKEYWY